MAASNTIYHHTIVHPELVLDVMCYVTMWGDSVSKLVKGWLGGVCVCLCNAAPETAGVHTSPTAASERHNWNPPHENTQRLWLHEQVQSWRRDTGRKQSCGCVHNTHGALTTAYDHVLLDCLPVSTHGLQHPNSSRGRTLKALADVICVGTCPVLKHHLPGLTGPGQRLHQVLHLVGGAAGGQIRSLHQGERVEEIYCSAAHSAAGESCHWAAPFLFTSAVSWRWCLLQQHIFLDWCVTANHNI